MADRSSAVREPSTVARTLWRDKPWPCPPPSSKHFGGRASFSTGGEKEWSWKPIVGSCPLPLEREEGRPCRVAFAEISFFIAPAAWDVDDGRGLRIACQFDPAGAFLAAAYGGSVHICAAVGQCGVTIIDPARKGLFSTATAGQSNSQREREDPQIHLVENQT